MSVAASLLVRVGADTKDAETGLSRLQGKMQSAASGMKRAGTSLSLGVTAPIMGLGAAAVMASTNFNASMANIGTLLTDLEDPATRIAELKTGIQDLAIATGKSTSDLADGAYQVISAFGDTSETLAILDINARAAAAGMATTEQAINLTSAVTKGYGDTSAEAVQQVSDLAFLTVKLGQTTFPELASSMGRVVPIAQELGVTQEELFAVFATTTGVVGSAAEVSTQFRGVLQALMVPTSDMAALISDMGYESGQAMLQQLGLQGTIDAVTGAAEESGTPLQKYISNFEALPLVLSLAGSQSDSFTEKLAAMSEAAGATDAAFAAQTEGVNALGFKWTQAKQKMAVTAQVMGDALGPALLSAMEAAQPLIDGIAEMAQRFTELDPKTQQIILGVTAFAVALGPVLVVLGSVVGAVSTLAPLFGVLATAVGALMSPIGLVVVAVGGLLAILFDWGGANEKVASTLEGWGLESVANGVRALHEGVEAVVGTLKQLFSGEMTFSEFFSAVVPGWIETLFDWAWPLLGPVAWVIKLMEWAWPRMERPAWLNKLLDFSWPSFPRLPKWMGGGGDEENPPAENATGSLFGRGLTLVGERGPELVQLPRGSQVYPNRESMEMMAGPVTVNVTVAEVQGQQDYYRLARLVAKEIQRAR